MRKGLKRLAKSVGSIALVAGLSTSLVACGSSSSSSTGTKTGGSGGNSSKNVTIRVVAANHPWTEAIQKMLPQFEKQTGIHVKLDSYFEDQLTQKVSVEFASHTDNIDVLMFRPLQDGKMFHENGYLANLNDYVSKDPNYTKDFLPSAIGSVKDGSDLFGLPLVTETEVLYYRKDLLQKAGLPVPKTLKELKADAEKLNDPSKGIAGFVSRGKRAAAVTQFSSYLYAFGGDFMKDGKATLNTPEAIKAFEYYGNLLKNDGPKGTLNMSWPEAMAVFTQGKAAFYTDASSLFSNATDPSKSQVADKVGFAPFPAGPDGTHPYNVTSWALGIGANSKNKDAAWQFIKWAESKDMVMKLQKDGNPGARISVWNSPEGTAKFPKDLASAIAANGKADATPYDRPIVLDVGKARDIIGDVIVAAQEGKDVKAAADKANKEFQTLLDNEKKK